MGAAEALVFDFNGTLSDDEWVLCDILRELFAEALDARESLSVKGLTCAYVLTRRPGRPRLRVILGTAKGV